jgi:hypothetical protein
MDRCRISSSAAIRAVLAARLGSLGSTADRLANLAQRGAPSCRIE